jgi:uncharacterized protein
MNDATYPLLPKISDDTAPFWQGCRDRRLLFQKCSACGHVRYPASILCPECLSIDCKWIESKGEGRIYSFVVFQRAFHPSMAGRIPYVVAVVELDEGPSFLTNIVDCDPAQVCCEQKVQLKWENAVDGLFLPMFRMIQGDNG